MAIAQQREANKRQCARLFAVPSRARAANASAGSSQPKGTPMSNEGKRVRTHYTGTFDDGTVFDSSVSRGEPLEFICMAGQMIPGFDAAVKEMAVGETKNVHIPAADAYGERDEELVQRIPKANVPEADQLPVGETVYMQGPGGQPFPVKVVEVGETDVVFDMNHEMAGKDLNFEITLVEIVEG